MDTVGSGAAPGFTPTEFIGTEDPKAFGHTTRTIELGSFYHSQLGGRLFSLGLRCGVK